jgi:WD40 repeat protein
MSGCLVVGMYELVEGQRKGGISYLQLSDEAVGGENFEEFLDLSCGVLDLHVIENSSRIVCSCSDSSIKILAKTADSTEIRESIKIPSVSEDVVDNVIMQTHIEGNQAWSVSTGGVIAMIDLSVARLTSTSDFLVKHSTQNWCTSCTGDKQVMVGSDDGYLNILNEECNELLSRIRHPAGVTCIGKFQEYQIFTGCYDEHLRIFDIRMNNQRPLETVKFGGGVWRFQEQTKKLYRATCCYGGVEVWKYEDNHWLQISESIGGDSLVYASVDLGDGKLAYTDFYNRKVHIV